MDKSMKKTLLGLILAVLMILPFVTNASGQEASPSTLDKAGIKIYGYVEGGYFHDFSALSPNSGPTYIGFNSFKNTGILDKDQFKRRAHGRSDQEAV